MPFGLDPQSGEIRFDPQTAVSQTNPSLPNAPNLSNLNVNPPSQGYPRLEPPSEHIMNDAAEIAKPNLDLWSKAKALGDVGLNALGLPQEGLTRLLSGNQYALPSDVPAVQSFGEKFGLNPAVAGMVANIFTDPFLLFSAGHGISNVVKGMFAGQALAGKLPENLNVIRNVLGPDLQLANEGLLFRDRESLQKVLNEAGLDHLPIANNQYGFTVNWNLLHDPENIKNLMLNAKKSFVQRDIDPFIRDGNNQIKLDNLGNPITRAYELGDTLGQTLPSTEKLKGSDNWNLAKDFVGTPGNLNPLMSKLSDVLADGKNTVARYVTDSMTNKVSKVLDDLMPNGGWYKGNGPLERALTYGIRGADLDHDLFTKFDPEALKAVNSVGQTEYALTVKSLKSIMLKDLTGLPPEALKKFASDDATLKNMMDTIHATDTPNMPMTWDVSNIFGSLDKINPNTANLTDLTNHFYLWLGNERYGKPAVQMAKQILNNAEIQTTAEKQYGQALIDSAAGVPNSYNQTIAQWMIDQAPAFRQWLYGDKLINAPQDFSSNPLARWFESKVEGAQTSVLGEYGPGEAQASRALDSAGYYTRNLLYKSLIGGAIDTAVKTTTQIFNTIVKFGYNAATQGMGSYLNPQMRNYLQADGLIDRTVSQMQEFYSKVPWTQKDNFLDFLMKPHQWVSNFNRGTTFLTALQQQIEEGGMQNLGQAIDRATEATRNLNFGFSVTDMSPYARGNPIERTFFQLSHYPLKESEQLYNMVRGTGEYTKGAILRYATLLGAGIAYGDRLGVDTQSLLLGGLVPGVLAGNAPVEELISRGTNVAKSWFESNFTDSLDPAMQSPSKWWSGLGQFLQMTLPAGRYAEKVGRNLFEQLYDSQTWNLRQQVNDHPWVKNIADTLGVRPDPQIDFYDRSLRLLGFQSTHEETRKEFKDFLYAFSNRYREASSQINQVFNQGGDWSTYKEKWVNALNHDFSKWFDKFHVPEYVIYASLSPKFSAQQVQETQRPILRQINSLPSELRLPIRSNLPQGY